MFDLDLLAWVTIVGTFLVLVIGILQVRGLFRRRGPGEVYADLKAESRLAALALKAGATAPDSETALRIDRRTKRAIRRYIQSTGDLPTGTVTFVLMDIVDSARLWQSQPEAMKEALKRRDIIIGEAIDNFDGHIVESGAEGDHSFTVFKTAKRALEAAVQLQTRFQTEPLHAGDRLSVRIAIHSGDGELRTGEYWGIDVAKAQRLRDAGYGGQILVSEATRDLVKDELPRRTRLSDLGAHRLKDIVDVEHIFQLIHSDLPSVFPALKGLEGSRHNLPSQVTSFVGRKRELLAIDELLSKSRLITLTGAGGSGKTRLALEVGRKLIDQFPDGVWMIEFAALTDGSLVAQQMAASLNLQVSPDTPALVTLSEHLRNLNTLLILDNCEHLIASCASVAQSLLEAASDIRLLATSRERLNIPGETTHLVPSLQLPDGSDSEIEGYEAIRLFIDRAGKARPGFEITKENTEWVVQICRQLDGIPLAIELAAARSNLLSPEEIVGRLDDRFLLLTGGSRTALPRQQTLEALISWSYDLLLPPEQWLFICCGSFQGGFSLQAAETVCSGEQLPIESVLEALGGLINKSLVIAEERPGNSRYRMLESIRQFAMFKLAESKPLSDSTGSRQLAWCMSIARDAIKNLRTVQSESAIATLELEQENIRGALDWAISNEDPSALELTSAIGDFWQLRGYVSEGRARLRQVLEAFSEVDGKDKAQVLHLAGTFAYVQGDFADAQASLEKALEILRRTEEPAQLALSLSTLGVVRWGKGDFQGARHALSESLALWRELGDQEGIAGSLNNLGLIAQDEGDLATARSHYDQALTIQREAGDKREIATQLNNLGEVARVLKDFEAAHSLYAESLALDTEVGNKWGMADSMRNLGIALHYLGGRDADAREKFKKAIELRMELGDKNGIAECLEGFALIEAAEKRSAILYGFVEALREAIGSPRSPSDADQHTEKIAYLQKNIGEERFKDFWHQGRSKSIEEAIRLVLEP